MYKHAHIHRRSNQIGAGVVLEFIDGGYTATLTLREAQNALAKVKQDSVHATLYTDDKPQASSMVHAVAAR